MKAARRYVLGVVGALVGIWAMATLGCANEQQQKGHELYGHYCSHCHGESGRQNEGFNWSSMPDPKPKDLTNKSEMATLKDEDIFNTISRDMKDTSEGGDVIGDDDFAVPTMPTFKYTLSEDEIWAIVGYVRGLHGMKLEFKVEERKKELAAAVQTAQGNFDQATKTYEAAEKQASEEAEKKNVDVDDAVYAKEMAAMGQAKKELDAAQAALNYFSTRPGKGMSVPRPDLTVKPEQVAKMVELGKRLYEDKYGCNGCHSLGAEGGKVGPALGLSDADAKAVTMYLGTLRGAKSEDETEATTAAPAAAPAPAATPTEKKKK